MISNSIAVLQPHFLPWPGYFEQIRLTDLFCFYDDVQMPQGRNLIYRVKIVSQGNPVWLSAPIRRTSPRALISDIEFSEELDWRTKHLNTIYHSYRKALHFSEMYDLAESIYANRCTSVSEFNITSIRLIAQSLGLTFHSTLSSTLGIVGSSSHRLVKICQHLGRSTYITGLGALNYLDHELFERAGIDVCYMKYKIRAYDQKMKEFSPYVSIFDLISNCGLGCLPFLESSIEPWRDTVARA